MPDQQLLLHFLVPALIFSLIAVALAWAINRFKNGYPSSMLVGLLFPIAAIVGLYWHEGVRFPLERDWQHGIFIVAVLSWVLSAIPIRTAWNPIPAGIVAAFALLGCKYVFPMVGDDSQFDAMRSNWTLAIVAAAFLNTLLIRLVSAFQKVYWSNLILASQLGAIAAVSMSAYATLSAVVLNYFASVIVIALGAMLLTRPSAPANRVNEESVGERNIYWPMSIQGPSILASVLMTACFRNYNFSNTPLWVYGLLLFVPAIVCLVDLVFLRKAKTWKRVLAAAILASILSGLIIATVFQSSGSESW